MVVNGSLTRICHDMPRAPGTVYEVIEGKVQSCVLPIRKKLNILELGKLE